MRVLYCFTRVLCTASLVYIVSICLSAATQLNTIIYSLYTMCYRFQTQLALKIARVRVVLCIVDYGITTIRANLYKVLSVLNSSI